MSLQSDVLKPYVPAQYPQSGDDNIKQRWHTNEHDRLRRTVGLLVQVVKQLEARIVALGG